MIPISITYSHLHGHLWPGGMPVSGCGHLFLFPAKFRENHKTHPENYKWSGMSSFLQTFHFHLRHQQTNVNKPYMSNKSNCQQGTDSGNGHATLWQSIGTQLPQVRHAANRCHHRILSCELGSHLSQNCSETMIENSLKTPWIIPKNMCLSVFILLVLQNT